MIEFIEVRTLSRIIVGLVTQAHNLLTTSDRRNHLLFQVSFLLKRHQIQVSKIYMTYLIRMLFWSLLNNFLFIFDGESPRYLNDILIQDIKKL